MPLRYQSEAEVANAKTSRLAGSGVLLLPRRSAKDAKRTRAVYETAGIQFGSKIFRIGSERLEASTGKRDNRIRVVGGGSRIELLNQFIADCWDRAYERLLHFTTRNETK